MAKYVPGALINEVTARIQESEAAKIAFENGYYDGQYVVAEAPRPPLSLELEEIRTEALNRWSNRLVDLDEILKWIGSGAIDSETREKIHIFPTKTDQATARLLINRGIFERHS